MTLDLAQLAHRLGARLVALERSAGRAVELRQVTVDDYRAGPPRVVDVEMDDGIVPDVPLLEHHAAPSVGDSVWISKVRSGAWLYYGRQG